MSTARTVAAHSSVWPACTVVLALLAVLGLAPLSPALVFLAATGMAWAVAAVGLDAFSGYLGQVSFGHAAFVAGGAYGSTVLTNHFGWPLQVSAVAAVGGTAVLSAAIGMILLRLRDFGLVLGTFFLTFVSTALLSGTLLADFTNAASGLQTSRLLLAGTDLSSGRAYYFTCWVVLAVVTMLSAWLAQSGPGRMLRLVKRSDAMALSLGVSPRRVRLLAFVWSATLASVGGVLVALGAGYISPEGFGVQASIMLFAMVAVGGLGSVAGPVVGAVLLLTVPAQLQFAETGQQLLFATLLLLVFVGARGGLYSLVAPVLERSTRRLARRRPAPALTPDALTAESAASATSSLGLVTHAVTLDYGGVRALDDVRLQVRPGTIHALIGPNGAGKTSLLNCLTGLERPTAGRVEVTSDGESPGAGPRIHRTFQNHAVVADLTAVENVTLGLHGAGSTLGRRRQRTARAEASARRALLDLGVPEHRHWTQGADLTLAESKLVDLARALVGSPGLLVLDEPTAGLSVEEMHALRDVVRTLNDRTALTILVVAHHVGWVRAVAGTTTVLAAGKVIADGPTDEVLALPRTQETFLGQRADQEVHS